MPSTSTHKSTWTIRSNGTLVNGLIVKKGQIFINKALERQIIVMEPYASHTETQHVQNDVLGYITLVSC